MFFRLLIWGFILVMIFRFIARFIFPILQITRITQDRLRNMQKQMEDMQQNQNTTQKNNQVKEGDYIDYEEIK